MNGPRGFNQRYIKLLAINYTVSDRWIDCVTNTNSENVFRIINDINNILKCL